MSLATPGPAMERGWREEYAATEPQPWRESGSDANNEPVIGVSFWEAEAFCCWAGGRLPTEREWEAAARGPQGHEYPWGGQWADGICNTDDAALGRTSPVGLFPRSRQKELGIEDLAGNVMEWCRDDGEDAGRPGEYRVLRGGSCEDDRNGARTDTRDYDLHPNERGWLWGFRIVCATPPSEP